MDAPEIPEERPAPPSWPAMPPASMYATDPKRFILETEAFILAARAYREWLAKN